MCVCVRVVTWSVVSTDETVFIIDISYQCTSSPLCFKCCSYELHSLKFYSSFAPCMMHGALFHPTVLFMPFLFTKIYVNICFYSGSHK